MRARGLTLRIRDEGKKYKVTLKRRAPDRYLAAATELATTGDDPEWKFEEDILPPFVSRFAHSVSFETKNLPGLVSISDLQAVFPKLDLGLPANTPLNVVNDFVAEERMRKLAKIRFDESTVVKLALSFWYFGGEPGEYPVVAEFSFDYDLPDKENVTELEDFPVAVVAGSNAFFAALQRQSGWLDLSGTTKTAAAYDAF